MASPTEEEWKTIEGSFRKHVSFANYNGATDGKHVQVIKPADSGFLFYNRNTYFNVVLLGVCDSNYQFTFVDTGSYSKTSDSSTFTN
jgi:hypothetical protein